MDAVTRTENLPDDPAEAARVGDRRAARERIAPFRKGLAAAACQ